MSHRDRCGACVGGCIIGDQRRKEERKRGAVSNPTVNGDAAIMLLNGTDDEGQKLLISRAMPAANLPAAANRSCRKCSASSCLRQVMSWCTEIAQDGSQLPKPIKAADRLRQPLRIAPNRRQHERICFPDLLATHMQVMHLLPGHQILVLELVQQFANLRGNVGSRCWSMVVSTFRARRFFATTGDDDAPRCQFNRTCSENALGGPHDKGDDNWTVLVDLHVDAHTLGNRRSALFRGWCRLARRWFALVAARRWR